MATRNKQVFPRDTVAHLWAHQAQESARDSSGNFYFNRRTIYSYGAHFAIAHIFSADCGPDLAGRVLWNDATYSNTTSKMQSVARQALTHQQYETMLHMPGTIGMGRNIDPHAIERALVAKRLPDVTPLLLARVVESVAGITGKRYGSGPFEACVNEARRAETLARAFYVRAGKKYPLAAIDSRPVSSDKTEWAAWIRSYALQKFKTDYADLVALIGQQMADISASMADVEGDLHLDYRVNNYAGTLNTIAANIDKAAKLYVSIAGTSPSMKLATLRKRHAALDAQARPIIDAYAAACARRELQQMKCEAFSALRHFQKGRRNFNDGRRYANEFEYLANKMADAIAALPESEKGAYQPLQARMRRASDWHTGRELLGRAERDMQTAESYVPGGHIADAIRVYRGVETACKNAIRYAGQFPAWHVVFGKRLQDMQTASTAAVQTLQAQLQARDADKLRAWLSGESNLRPSHELGTFARINGDRIETTRGANVPIEHACRLARLYAVCVKRGGQEWRDGAGPQVGYYRVNKIGADGSLVIGCHEFTADEATRLHALLQSCEACADIAAVTV